MPSFVSLMQQLFAIVLVHLRLRLLWAHFLRVRRRRKFRHLRLFRSVRGRKLHLGRISLSLLLSHHRGRRLSICPIGITWTGALFLINLP